ncbi:MAG: Trm112 family protein [bacterium]
MPLTKELLDILACPKCKGDLKYDQKSEKIICNVCRLRFNVIDGKIPNMLIDEAEKF